MSSNKKSKKGLAVGILIAAAALSALIFLSRSGSSNNQPPKNASKGTLTTIDNPVWDFGTISMANGKVRKSFKIKNASNDPAFISKVFTSCMCTQANLIHNDKTKGPFGMPGHAFVPAANENIKPGEEATVEIVFDPAAHGPAGIGRIDRVVTVETDSGTTTQLKFSATVTP